MRVRLVFLFSSKQAKGEARERGHIIQKLSTHCYDTPKAVLVQNVMRRAG